MAELRQELMSVLDRVHRGGDSFLFEQDGEAVAALEPVIGAATWSTVARALRDTPRPDSAFAADLEEIQSNQPAVPTDVWLS